MTKPSIGKKIVSGLKSFADGLVGHSSDILDKLQPLPEYKIEYQNPSNWETQKMSREMYLEDCRAENTKIREEYGPILITYIRKIPSMTLPGRKFTNEELLRFYHNKFQNVPIGCVVAIKIDNEIHYGWSLCNKKDRFTKVVCLNKALNRAICGDGNFDNRTPTLVSDYLVNLEHRAQKYFNKYDH